MDWSLLLSQHSLQLVVVLVLLSTAAPKTTAADDVALPNCKESCGRVPISYPFGLTDGCYLHVPGQDDQPFKIGCNSTSSQLQFTDHTLYPYNITNISFGESELQVMVTSSRNCYTKDGYYNGSLYRSSVLDLPPSYGLSNKNYIVSVGCNRLAAVTGYQKFPNPDSPITIGFSGLSLCQDALGKQFPDTCGIFGCSQSLVPVGLHNLTLDVWAAGTGLDSSVWHWSESYPCSYGFVVDQRNFTFEGNKTFAQLVGPRQELPVLVNWTIGSDNCEKAKLKNETAFACKGVLAECVDRAEGYFCRCKSGYQGNPYLLGDCKDIDECKIKTSCGLNSTCINSPVGDYTCKCSKGYIHVDGDLRSCVKSPPNSNKQLKVALGVCLSFLVVVLIVFWIYRGFKIRKLERLRKAYFENNGGNKLREMMESSGGAPPVKIYSENDIKQATNNFNRKQQIGEGAYGIVYKGTLDKKEVAIKVPRTTDSSNDKNIATEFAKELNILSRITHANVVRLLGCCLETAAPILVYEFVNNGTVYEHIHQLKGKKPLSFQLRLKIAIETAASLTYLHYYNNPQIVHRDVKTSNILVDDKFTAKVSDFGASKFVSEDQHMQATFMYGTPGYLDPEYLQSNQLTEKSDVYSYGVVLVELITSEAAISSSKPEEERNLANHFIKSVKENSLQKILDHEIIKEANFEVAEKVAHLAKRCLSVMGSMRPTMKDVFEEIQAIGQAASSQFPLGGRPDASPKGTDTLIPTSSPSDSYHDVTSAEYDRSKFDDASLTNPVNSGR